MKKIIQSLLGLVALGARGGGNPALIILGSLFVLGGMLIANGIVIWLAAQWGIRVGERWLWLALAVAGNAAFAAAISVHVVVGYTSWLHFAPAIAGWCMWLLALGLTHEWMCQRSGGADGHST